MKDTAVLRNIQTNILYRDLGHDKYRNLITGVEDRTPDKAKEVFRLNVEATGLLNKWPMIEELIKALNLRIEK